MMESKKVSVIVPCYNCRELVSETVEGLKNQTFRNFEVILVNDGSTDDTLDVLKKLSVESGLDVKVTDKKNGGVSSARNAGIETCTGDYVAFVDSDDVFNPRFLELLVNAIQDSDISFCRLSRKKEAAMAPATVDEAVGITVPDAMRKLLYEMESFGFYCYLYRRDVLNLHGIRFDENTKYYEDREFIWKYISHCKSFAFVDAPLYWYRYNPTSVTLGKMTWRKTDSFAAIKRCEEYLKKTGNPIYEEYCKYMMPRSVWTAAKAFSLSRDRQLFNRLKKEYDVRACMKVTAHDRKKLVRFSSYLYLINPGLFYLSGAILSGISKRKGV